MMSLARPQTQSHRLLAVLIVSFVNPDTYIVETLPALSTQTTLLDHLLQHRNRLDELFGDLALFGFLLPSLRDV